MLEHSLSTGRRLGRILTGEMFVRAEMSTEAG